MEQKEEIKEMTVEELKEFLNRQEEGSMVQIRIADGKEGGGADARGKGI